MNRERQCYIIQMHKERVQKTVKLFSDHALSFMDYLSGLEAN